MKKFDVVIAGGGILGLSIGRSILMKNPKLSVLVVEKEESVGQHASGRNSGVLHAGFYYSPDSMKARFCSEGNRLLTRLAANHKIEVRKVGKVILSSTPAEEKILQNLFERGTNNGVELELLESKLLKSFEPLAKTHETFLWSPSTSISDPRSIISAIENEFITLGGLLLCNSVISIEKQQEILVNKEKVTTRFFVNAAGSQSDRIAHKFGLGLEYIMFPFLGNYRITNFKSLKLQRLVYPVPHHKNPFLGVHLTLTLSGKVKIGPSAIPLIGREQYNWNSGFSGKDLNETLKAAISVARHDFANIFSLAKTEIKKLSTKVLVSEAAKLVPAVKNVDSWERYEPGIRSQLVHTPSGKLIQDFLVLESNNTIHILNAVSPGWTASLAFSEYIADLALSSI